jgi:hypothetical protein
MKNIHVLPTDQPSRLWLYKNFDNLLAGLTVEKSRDIHPQYIYITSDEEIKEGDFALDIRDNDIVKQHPNQQTTLEDLQGGQRRYFFKIILTTNQNLIGVQAIDDEFLEWFVNNHTYEFVEIKENLIITQNKPLIQHQGSEPIIVPHKIGYKIIIPNLEIWKDIPDFEGYYQVSNFGNVKSLERYVKGKVENRLQKENILSKRLVGNLGNQYYAVTLCNNKDRKQIKVSVLVAMAFLNHTPNGYVGFTVDHIDNNPLNNNVDNLQVITKRENSSKDRKGISKYTGVTFNKKSNKWRSQIWINGKNKTLGSFNDELEAHRAYQKELQQHLKS